ncbi:hypothetical protein [Citrobacter braakii]|uniref:hypothetical protein n=1 Tax=Citrobacter braakii TaxID=57706 RepID=UPI0039750E1F
MKNTVWKGLADTVWNEVTPFWPLDAITGSNFDALAEAHSKTWQRFPSESCRKALYAELIREHIQLNDPIFSTYDSLFPAEDFGLTVEEEQALREERKRLNEEYLTSLPALNGRLYSELSSHEKTLAQHYTKMVSFEPIGNDDFRVLVNADK